MTSNRLDRISGFALLAGACTFVGHIALRSVLTAGPDPATFARDGLWVPVNGLGVAGAVLVLLGLPAACVRLARSGGATSVVGVALVAVAWMFFGLFLSVYGLLLLPWLAAEAPSLVAASTPPPALFVGVVAAMLLSWFVGALLLAVPFVRRQARPSWLGIVFAASAVWMPIGNLLIAPSGPASNVVVNVLSNMGPVMLLVGFAYVGSRAGSEA